MNVGEANMLDFSALLVGTAGLALVAGSLAPVAIDTARSTATTVVVKSERLDRVGAGTVRMGPVRSDGAVLFQADPFTGTRWVAQSADRPTSSARDVPAPAARQPAATGEEPGTAKPKRTVGCETAVSPLVKLQAANVPGRCLA
jgi:hypothetical protein